MGLTPGPSTACDGYTNDRDTDPPDLTNNAEKTNFAYFVE
jgi:hypothetical protein